MTSGKIKYRSIKLNNKENTKILTRISQFVSQKFFLLCLGNVILLTILLCPKIDFFFETNLVEGEISPKNFWAPRDLSIEDTQTTEKKRKEILEKTPAIYDFDDKSFEYVSNKITNAFIQLRALYNKLLELQTMIQSETEALPSPTKIKKRTPSPSPTNTSNVDALQAESIEKIKLAIQQIITSDMGQNYQNSGEVLSFFIREKMSIDLENYIKNIFASLLNKKIVDNKASFLQDLENGIQMNYLHSNRKVNLKPEDGGNILDLNSAKAEIQSMMEKENIPDRDMENLTTFIFNLLRPNLTFNKSETEKAKKSAIEKIEPVFFTFKKGQMILRERDKVTADNILILNSIKKKFVLSDFLLRTIGFALLIFLLISLVFLLLNELSKIFRGNFKSHLIFSAVVIFYIVLTKAQIWISNSIADSVHNDSLQNLSSYYYLLPMSLGPFLVTLLLDFPSGLMMAFLASLLTGVLPSFNIELVIRGFVSGFVASFWIRKYNSRTGIMKTGFIVGVFNAFFIIFSSMQQTEFGDLNITFFKIGCSFFGGILASIITLVALPAFE
ncbi:hypothetical protein KKB18_11405, partial [bacterium]|nr:hypothetical protein [bacterium]